MSWRGLAGSRAKKQLGAEGPLEQQTIWLALDGFDRLPGCRLVRFSDASRRVGRWLLVWRMHRVEEGDECCYLGWRERRTISWHVTASLNDLTDDLIFC